MNQVNLDGPVALQSTNAFVGRTMNWLYDHLRFVPRFRLVVLCKELENRDEFPAMEAWDMKSSTFTRRLWRRFAGENLYPGDLHRLRKYAPSLLHSHFGYVAVHDLELKRALRVPWFVGFYGADVYALGHRPEWQERYREVFEYATRVLALGPTMAEHLELLGCPREKIVVHPLGVPVAELPCAPRVLKKGEPLRVLFAGTFREKKGIRYVIEGAAIARGNGVNLELKLVGEAGNKPGDAETKMQILDLIDRLGISEQVVYYPPLSFRDLVSLALQSHVLLAPSITAADGDAEGTPFVLQQMMATGMPALATIHSDIPYIFGKHSDLLVPERDSKAIANRLIEYADNPDKLVAHGTVLRERICRDFDVRRHSICLSELYDGAIEGRPANSERVSRRAYT